MIESTALHTKIKTQNTLFIFYFIVDVQTRNVNIEAIVQDIEMSAPVTKLSWS